MSVRARITLAVVALVVLLIGAAMSVRMILTAGAGPDDPGWRDGFDLGMTWDDNKSTRDFYDGDPGLFCERMVLLLGDRQADDGYLHAMESGCLDGAYR
jgi:hypothetical protein